MIRNGGDTPDFLYAEDVGRAIHLATEAPLCPQSGLTICGSTGTMRDAVALVRRLLPDADLRVEDGLTIGAMNYDPSVTESAIGYSPQFTLEDGFRATINAVRKKHSLPRRFNPPVGPDPSTACHEMRRNGRSCPGTGVPGLRPRALAGRGGLAGGGRRAAGAGGSQRQRQIDASQAAGGRPAAGRRHGAPYPRALRLALVPQEPRLEAGHTVEQALSPAPWARWARSSPIIIAPRRNSPPRRTATRRR